MPLPDIPRERCLGIDLELMDIDWFAKQLFQWLNQTGIVRQHLAGLAVLVAAKRRARRAILFPPYLLSVLTEGICSRLPQNIDFFCGEAFWDEHITELIKFFEFFLGQFHGSSSFLEFGIPFYRSSTMTKSTGHRQVKPGW